MVLSGYVLFGRMHPPLVGRRLDDDVSEEGDLGLGGRPDGHVPQRCRGVMQRCSSAEIRTLP